jgi:hypothetical protein
MGYTIDDAIRTWQLYPEYLDGAYDVATLDSWQAEITQARKQASASINEILRLVSEGLPAEPQPPVPSFTPPGV